MAISNKKVAEAFIRGNVDVKGSNFKTVELDNGNVGIVGYNRAVYAELDGTEVLVYLGWDGHSKSTSNHFRLIREAAEEVGGVYLTGKSRKKHFSSDK